MAGPQRINSTPISQRTYENNLHMVGGQRQLTNRKAVETPAEGEDRTQVSQDRVSLAQDHVSLAQDHVENAAHAGVLQEQNDDSEQLYLPAPKDEPENLPVPVPQGDRLPVPVQDGAALPVKSEPLTGEIIEGDWEPRYPGTPEQGLSPYVPGGPGGPDGPGGPGGPGAPGGPDGPGGPGGPGGPSQADAARNYQQFQQEQQEVQQIYMQMMADRQKWMMEMWKIIQDTQTKMYEIMASAVLYRQQVSDKINQMWDDTIRGA